MERHLKRRKGDVMPRPRPEYKAKGFVSDDETRFNNYKKVVYGIDLRPTIIICLKSVDTNRFRGGRSTYNTSLKLGIVIVCRFHT